MLYIFGITVIFLTILLAQKLLPAKWQIQLTRVYLVLFIILAFNLLIHPYRIERIWEDIMFCLETY